MFDDEANYTGCAQNETRTAPLVTLVAFGDASRMVKGLVTHAAASCPLWEGELSTHVTRRVL